MRPSSQGPRWRCLSTLVLLGVFPCAFCPRTALAADTSIVVDTAATGRVFHGLGAVSGGGGTSRLLRDYPPAAQAEILDYLFKPNYGAALQILKVEIGGDTDSTNGSEPSHQRTPGDRNYQRGYEWWLLKQAKARNPSLTTAALEWGAPGWFSGGFWSDDNIAYIVDWLVHAQSDHGIQIDYAGAWNERRDNGTDNIVWYEKLRAAIVAAGLSTKIIADDNMDWNAAEWVAADPAFSQAVDVVGTHYPCGWMSNVGTCGAPRVDPGKPLWASEMGSGDFHLGAPRLARAFNRQYIDGRITAALNWSLIGAWQTPLPYYGSGLMLADQPWSGSYRVGKSLWVTAHTTQFVQPGWSYEDAGSGRLLGAGSYVTLHAPDASDYSVILETTQALEAQTVTVTVAGRLGTKSLHVWRTNLDSWDAGDWFVRGSEVTPVDGKYTVTLEPEHVYTLTTTTGQSKGVTAPSGRTPLALPFKDDFEAYEVGKTAKYFSDIEGTFETASCDGGRAGVCLRQTVPQWPIQWMGGPQPTTLVGDPGWADYQVSVDALLEQAGAVELVGRVSLQSGDAVGGYHLKVSSSGSFSLYREEPSRRSSTWSLRDDSELASGELSFPVGSWHKFGLVLRGNVIEARYDDATIATISDERFPVGLIALQASPYQNAQFDNFAVEPLGDGAHCSLVSLDDQDPEVGRRGPGWGSRVCDICYRATFSWSWIAGDVMTVPFEGTRVLLHGVVDPGHGTGAVSVDGAEETIVDFFAPTRDGKKLLWSSPVLRPGAHTLELRVTGDKNPSSEGYAVAADRIDVLVPAAPESNSADAGADAGADEGGTAEPPAAAPDAGPQPDVATATGGGCSCSIPGGRANDNGLLLFGTGLLLVLHWMRRTSGHSVH